MANHTSLFVTEIALQEAQRTAMGHLLPTIMECILAPRRPNHLCAA